MFSRRLAPLFRDHWPDEGHGTVHFPVIGAGRSVAPGRQEWGVLGKTWNPGRGFAGPGFRVFSPVRFRIGLPCFTAGVRLLCGPCDYPAQSKPLA